MILSDAIFATSPPRRALLLLPTPRYFFFLVSRTRPIASAIRRARPRTQRGRDATDRNDRPCSIGGYPVRVATSQLKL